MLRTIGFIGLWFLLRVGLAQEREVLLSDVSVTARQPGHFKHTRALDSLKATPLTSTSQLLSELPGVYCKEYGPGAVSTLSVRGTAASHTPVLWNGIPISNFMLGVTDLSLIPPLLFSGARLTSGGNTQAAVSEDFGGILELSSLKEKDAFIRLSTQAGSFSSYGHGLTANQKIGQSLVNLKSWYLSAENDFPYLLDGVRRIQTHSARQQKGFEISTLIPLDSSCQLEVAGWWQDNHRELPPSLHQSVSNATQNDESRRLSARLLWNPGPWQWTLSQGLTHDRLLYTDQDAAIFSRSTTLGVFQTLGTTRTYKEWELGSSVWLAHYQAHSNSYENTARLQRVSVLLNARYQAEAIPLELQANLKAERAGYSGKRNYNVPLNPSLTAIYTSPGKGTIRLGVHRKYRLPTLNDLYWTPGGNPDLQPETGWTSELAWKKKFHIANRISYEADIEHFRSWISDYIQWLPNGNFWTARNVASVAITGFQIRQTFGYQWGSNQVNLGAEGTQIHSIQTGEGFAHDEGTGNQLIYIPVYQAKESIEFKRKNLSILVWVQQTSRRFVSPANDIWLPGFTTLNSRASWQFRCHRKADMKVFAEGYNLTGTSYQTLMGYPMPLSRFSVGLQANLYN